MPAGFWLFVPIAALAVYDVVRFVRVRRAERRSWDEFNVELRKLLDTRGRP